MKRPLGPPTPLEEALAHNARIVAQIDRHANKPPIRLRPGLAAFNARASQAARDPELWIANLTGPLLAGEAETTALIEADMEQRYGGRGGRFNAAVGNSLKRTAGTNYQFIVSYALARYLHATRSAWYLVRPVPKEFKKSLAIVFSAGVADPVQAVDVVSLMEEDTDTELEPDPEMLTAYTVEPDVDLLLRNAAWTPKSDGAEPIVLLSVKTSLVDRAGQAARWKSYFDLATNPCPHVHQPTCVYGRLGITMENAGLFHIRHGIVTANIYKLKFRDARHRVGELESGQTRSNTYMFDLKLTTRDDDEAVTPSDWRQFPAISGELRRLSRLHNLPE